MNRKMVLTGTTFVLCAIALWVFCAVVVRSENRYELSGDDVGYKYFQPVAQPII